MADGAHKNQQALDYLSLLVIGIARSTEANRQATDEHWNERFILPLRLGHLRVCCGGRALYTWTRPRAPLTQTPTPADWRREGAPLWVVDFLFRPELTVMQAVRGGHADMVRTGIAMKHEKYLFWRSGRDRYGYMRA